MSEFKEILKKYILVKYVQTRLKECDKNISKSIPWIQRKSLSNTIETHCKVLLGSLLNQKQSLRQNKFIVDSIIKYTLGHSENVLKANRKTKDIKSYMQLNSYIVFDEISKGIAENKNRKAIKFNIEKQLMDVQEKMKSKANIEEILQEKINA